MSTASIRAPDHKPSPVLEHNQKQLAAYLARARGPGETSMKFNLRPRPSGEAARVVFTDYEAPPDPDVGMPYKVQHQQRHRLVARHAVLRLSGLRRA